MAGKVQAYLVASEFNISVANLKRVLKRINELEIAPDIDPVRVDLIVQKLDMGENYYLIDNDIYKLLKKQFEESKTLIPISEVAKQNDIKPNSLNKYVQSDLGLSKARREGLITSNIFFDKSFITASASKNKVSKLANHFLISVAKKNRIQSTLLPDYSSSRRKNRIFSLLESVKIKTSDTGRRAGRIIGFGKDARGMTTPIVATYSSGDIFFASKIVKLQANQDFNGYTSLNPDKPPIEFIFGLNELTESKSKQLINIFLKSLNKKSVLIKPINGTKSLIAFSVITNSFDINIYDFQCHPGEYKRDQKIKEKNYGTFTRDQLIKALRLWKTGHGSIIAGKTNPNLIKIYSKMRKLVSWLPEEDVDAIENVANDAEISTSDYIELALNATKFAMPDQAIENVYHSFYSFLEEQIRLADSKNVDALE